MVSKQDLILEAVRDMKKSQEHTHKIVHETSIQVAKVEGHMKNMNGKINKAEVDIEKLETKVTENKVSLAKQGGIGGGSGMLGGAIMAKLMDWFSRLP